MNKVAFSNRNVFLDDYTHGKATVEEIEDYLDKWHEGNGYGVSAYEFLGLTKQEYFAWAEDPGKFKAAFERKHRRAKTARIARKIVAELK